MRLAVDAILLPRFLSCAPVFLSLVITCGPSGQQGPGGAEQIGAGSFFRSCPRKRGPSLQPWIPAISAFTRVHSPSKTGVNALNDALCAGMNGVLPRGR